MLLSSCSSDWMRWWNVLKRVKLCPKGTSIRIRGWFSVPSLNPSTSSLHLLLPTSSFTSSPDPNFFSCLPDCINFCLHCNPGWIKWCLLWNLGVNSPRIPSGWSNDVQNQIVKVSIFSCREWKTDLIVPTPCCRVSKDCHGYCYWICNHGIHWILCQTDPHSHQQHHCVSCKFTFQANRSMLWMYQKSHFRSISLIDFVVQSLQRNLKRILFDGLL